MSISFTQRVSIPDNVLFRELEGESVILDLDSEQYFGLDEVGTRMWQLITEADSIGATIDELVAEYDVEAEVLREDLSELIDTLVDKGLLSLAPGAATA